MIRSPSSKPKFSKKLIQSISPISFEKLKFIIKSFNSLIPHPKINKKDKIEPAEVPTNKVISFKSIIFFSIIFSKAPINENPFTPPPLKHNVFIFILSATLDS